MAVRKISVSVEEEALDYAERRAKRLKRSLSSVLTDALRFLRREEARRDVMKYLGDSGASDPQIEELIRSWRR